MSEDKAIVYFRDLSKGTCTDVEVPLKITANELVVSLNRAFSLGIDTTDIKQCFLRAENPIVLLRGEKTLEEFGVRNCTSIIFPG